MYPVSAGQSGSLAEREGIIGCRRWRWANFQGDMNNGVELMKIEPEIKNARMNGEIRSYDVLQAETSNCPPCAEPPSVDIWA